MNEEDAKKIIEGTEWIKGGEGTLVNTDADGTLIITAEYKGDEANVTIRGFGNCKVPISRQETAILLYNLAENVKNNPKFDVEVDSGALSA